MTTQGVEVNVGLHNRSSPRPRHRDVWLLPLFAVLATVMTFPNPTRLTSQIPGDGGDALFIIWTMRWVNHAAPHGWNTLWNPNILWPTKNVLAYSDTLLPVAPIFGALEKLTGSTALAFNLISLAAWTAGLWFTYRLALRLLGSWAPAVLVAVAFTFSTQHLAQYRHLQLVIGGLFPGVLLLVLRFLERPSPGRGATLAGALVALTLTASYYGLSTMLCTATIVVVHVALVRRIQWRHLIQGIAAGAFVTAALLGPFALHYSNVTGDPALQRQPDRAFNAAPSDLIAVSVDNRFVTGFWPVKGRFARKTNENWLFPGYVTTFLAAVGVVALASGRLRAARRVETAGVLMAAAVLGVLAFGDVATIHGHDVRLPFGYIRERLPGFAGVRVPARFMLAALLGMTVLAGFGAEALRRRLPPRFALLLVASLTTLVLVETATKIETITPEPTAAGIAVNQALAHKPAGPVVELPMKSSADGPAWPFVEASRQLASTIDWHPRLNGVSAFEPPQLPAIAAAVNTFPSDLALRTRPLPRPLRDPSHRTADRPRARAPAGVRREPRGQPRRAHRVRASRSHSSCSPHLS